jgi:hypothetical protein
MTQERSRMRRIGTGAVVAVLAALALPACGGDDEPAKDAPREKPAFVELEDRLGFGTEGIMARQNKVEASIQRCMRESGFDYVPVDPFAGQGIVARASRLNDEQFIEQFGYGISTLWGLGGRETDPNARIRGSLDPVTRKAYDRTLYGDHPNVTFVDAVDGGDLTRLGGCTREATAAAFGDGEVISAIVGKFDTLDERITSDRRMVRAEQAWIACMAAAGHPYRSEDAIEEDFTKRMEAIVGPIPGPLATAPPAGEKPRPYDRNRLRALQREEVAVARADFACEEKEITPVEAVVRPEYEARFQERNSALIQSVRQVWR